MANKKRQKENNGTAVIYARYSSHSQREVSLEQQIEKCQEYAKRNGYKVIHIYQDAAMSGRTDDRPQFQLMMKDAKKERFEYIIAWKSNRIGRNMTQTLANTAELAKYGVDCLYVEEDFDNTAAGRFALRNMMNVNQFYSENMAEDIRRGLMDNASKCMVNGVTPLGYKRGEDGKYAIDEPSAEIVRQIYKRFLEGWTITDLMNDLNKRGIKTKYGNPWVIQSFNKLLSNEQYIGVYKYSGVRIEGGIPEIIDKDTFAGVQKKLKDKKRPRGQQRQNDEYLLTGKCFCGMCGSPMVARAGTSHTGKKHDYYVCRRRKMEHACDKKPAPKERLEEKVCEAIKYQLTNTNLIDVIVAGLEKVIERIKEDSKLHSLQADLDAVNISLANLLKAVEAGLVNEVTKARMDELIQTRKDIEAAMKMEDQALHCASVEDVRDWLEGLRDGDLEDPEYMKELIRVFVRRVFVFDDRLELELNTQDGEETRIIMPLDGLDSAMAESSPEVCYAPPKRESAFTADFLFGLSGELNPRALGKAPGAPCNPRWPAPQSRSNPLSRAKKNRLF